MNKKVSLFWFRRDLRLEDNRALYEALNAGHAVLPLFIFDPEILETLPADDPRVSFIYEKLQEIRKKLQNDHGSSLAIFMGNPELVFRNLFLQYDVQSVFTNRDYEPYAIKRDSEIEKACKQHGISFHTYKDQLVFEKNEVVKNNGTPYIVYSPYMRKWRERLNSDSDLINCDTGPSTKNFISHTRLPNASLAQLGFIKSEIKVDPFELSPNLINSYRKRRNFPAQKATSLLGPHLRFGTVSVRSIVKEAMKAKDGTFLNELIWREFFMQILWHYPHTVHQAFKKPYDRIEWLNREEDFEAWKQGQTGYALVDAGMRQLNQSGYMHNRVRMLTASFLCKHLLIDWRWGEAYFAEKLLDYEMSSNVGNWQWAAGSGVDAAPYFRIFNPALQLEKFDKNLEYVRKWVPEYGSDKYPSPIVDHKFARERCITAYKKALD